MKRAQIVTAASGLAIVLASVVSPLFAQEPRPRLMSRAKHDLLQALVPKTDNAGFNRAMTDPRGFWYTEAEDKPTIQRRVPGRRLCDWMDARVRLNNLDPTSTTFEFPWLFGLGTDFALRDRFPLVAAKKLILPEGGKIVWENKMIRFNNGRRINFRQQGGRVESFTEGTGVEVCRWTFPVGTVSVEQFAQFSSRNSVHTHSVQVRIRDESGWDVDKFVPADSPKGYADLVRAVRPNPNANERRIIEHFERPQELVPHRIDLSVEHETRQAFEAFTGYLYPLPEMRDEKLVTDMLDYARETGFKSLRGKPFYKDARGNVAHGVTTEFEELSLTHYRDFSGAFSVDRESCNRCHRDTGQPAAVFNKSRDWYFGVIGSGKMLGLKSIINQADIHDGGPYRPATVRPEFADIVEQYDPSVHRAPQYSLLTYEGY